MHDARLRRFAPYALLAALVCATYAGSIRNGFVEWDDRLLVIDNPVSHGLTAHNVAAAFTSFDPELYIPLTFLSYQATFSVAGLAPWAFHAGNVALHLLSTLFVFAIARRLTRSATAAIVAAALFAVHPINTEAVAWIAARKDVLSAALALASMLLWLRWRDAGGVRDYRASIACFTLALLAKVSVIALPVAFVLTDWARGRRFAREDAKSYAPAFLLSVVFGWIALVGKGDSNSGLFLEKLLIGAKATVFYALHIVAPSGFSVLYPYTQAITPRNPDLLLPLLLVIAVTAGLTALHKRTPTLLAGWLVALAFLVPSFSNFAKGKDLLHDVYFASDRYAYLACIPAFIGIGMLAARCIMYQRRAAAVLIGVCIAMLSTLSMLQASTWHDSMGLFRNVLRSYPQSHVALNNVATLLFQQGQREKALEYYQASLKVRPNSMAFFNLGVIAEEANLLDRAEEFYRKALEHNPGYPDAHKRLNALMERRNPQ